jgi:O-antigen ligase
MQQRLQILSNDIVTYRDGNRDTPTGQRWQLNIAAVKIFLKHPIAGVGPEVVGGKPDGFAKEIQKMWEAGELSDTAADIGRCCQAHNEILAKAADLGILGVSALLALYLVPLQLFWRATKVANNVKKRAGILGITLVSGHFIFGLTVGLLGLTMTAAFYAFSVAVLLAACYNIDKSTETFPS